MAYLLVNSACDSSPSHVSLLVWTKLNLRKDTYQEDHLYFRSHQCMLRNSNSLKSDRTASKFSRKNLISFSIMLSLVTEGAIASTSHATWNDFPASCDILNTGTCFGFTDRKLRITFPYLYGKYRWLLYFSWLTHPPSTPVENCLPCHWAQVKTSVEGISLGKLNIILAALQWRLLTEFTRSELVHEPHKTIPYLTDGKITLK